MDLLKELSLRGKMIFVVLHQPSSDIFKMFDSLLILDVGGFQIYYGNPIESVVYFRDIVNAANKTQGACPECGNINPEQVFNIIETKIVNEYGRLTNTRKISAGQWYQYFKKKIKLPKIEHVTDKLHVTQEIPGRLQQFKIFTIRDVLSKLANKQYLYINMLEAPVLAFFISFMVKYYNLLDQEHPSYSFSNNENIPVYFFMSVVVSLFFGLTVSAEEIFRDRKILKREKFLHLSRSSYLFSKVFVMFAISAIQTFTFMVIGNFVLDIPLSEMRYWLILFSCSCFANMLGLNISASFNSAVTIYILIPVLIIPQLLLSGVVINFDKFNPKVGNQVGVPLVGEVMTSRWAFEAFMVTQFKDNPFEKQFYELDKTIAESDYKRVFYIPQLESHLALCLNNRGNWRNPRNEELTNSLTLLKNEIGYELLDVGEDNFPDINKLAIGKFDSTVYLNSMKFLNTLKQYYLIKQNNAMRQKENMVSNLTNTPEKLELFNQQRDQYQNKAVSLAVKGTTAPNRIVEYDGRLYQKIYPIYFDDHKPAHLFDFSANLFQPTKYFGGRLYDTLYFNLFVIWSITFLLYVSLYFDLLKKFIRLFEQRKHRRRERN
jgi:ABC transport system ATP-binding/permease protein